jgi:hypothetical protein
MKFLVFISVFALGLIQLTSAQKIVALDNWFNNEINPKNGKPYHYLWTDTAWSGFSRWGDIFQSRSTKIIQIKKPTSQILKNASIYIIVDPDTASENPNPNLVQADDIKSIKKWVKSGGILVLMANDAKNCEFTHFNRLGSEFGISFDFVSLHKVPKGEWDKGAFVSFPDHPVFKGITKIYMKEIASITLKKSAKPILTENGLAFIAESSFGKGKVIAIGDPWIYNEYMDHDRLPSDFQNRQAAENLTDYLIKLSK